MTDRESGGSAAALQTSALTIAGFDPSGGAGLQADLRVFESLGVVGWSVTTAITIQNTKGVHGVHPVDPSILREQLEAVFSDARNLGAVKIGMLGGAAQVRVVAEALRKWKPKNVVLDPVLASSGGVPLLDDPSALDELIPLCDLVTPNAHEPAGGRSVLLKGGHFVGATAVDSLYVDGEIVRTFRAPRLRAEMHGTGCLLSSAIAAHLALGASLFDAIENGKALVTAALRKALKIEGLYALTDPRRDPEETVRAALDGGARIVQLREKRLPTPQLIDLARRIRAMTEGLLFIVNDRVDVAVAANADGVHVGPDDMRPADVRRVMGDKIVGVSVSTVDETREAAPYASYFGVGAIFGSATKLDAGDAVGVARIAEIRAAFPQMPIVAIGGITRENIASVARAGADAAAVVAAIVGARDMVAAAGELAAIWHATRPQRR